MKDVYLSIPCAELPLNHYIVNFFVLIQISPLRPQRPKSQVINVISSERRFSVSPSPPASQATPPPITPRTKLSFSLQSSKLWFGFVCLFLNEVAFLYYFARNDLQYRVTNLKHFRTN